MSIDVLDRLLLLLLPDDLEELLTGVPDDEV